MIMFLRYELGKRKMAMFSQAKATWADCWKAASRDVNCQPTVVYASYARKLDAQFYSMLVQAFRISGSSVVYAVYAHIKSGSVRVQWNNRNKNFNKAIVGAVLAPTVDEKPYWRYFKRFLVYQYEQQFCHLTASDFLQSLWSYTSTPFWFTDKSHMKYSPTVFQRHVGAK